METFCRASCTSTLGRPVADPEELFTA